MAANKRTQIMLLFVLILFAVRIGAKAQIDQDAVPTARKLFNITPSRVPVTITAIRNLQNEHWLRDLEIEIRNDSRKPIYYLHATLHFPDIPKTTEVDGIPRGKVVTLDYGRWQLANRSQYPSPEDTPIKPGETCILRVIEPLWKGFESNLSSRNLSESLTKKVGLFVDDLRFEDGSGFIGGGYFSSN